MQPPNDRQLSRMKDAFKDAASAPEKSPTVEIPQEFGLRKGQTIGKCTIVRELGRGGMGAVYLAQHTTLDVPVAVKVLPKSIADRSPDYAERFLREARLAAKLRHPNVLAIMDADRDEKTGLYYMVTEFMDGGSIGDRLAKAVLSEKQASVIVSGIAKALQVAEKLGVVHRDIKPGNILYSRDGRVKLADLGLAKMQGTNDLTKSSSAIGTPFYMSPEQIADSKSVDIRSDIYSLGATYYHMVTGQPPYPGDDVYGVLHKVMTAPVPDPRAIRTDLSDSAAGIIQRMLVKDVKGRYQSPTEVLSDLSRGVVSPAPLDLEPAIAGVSAQRGPTPLEISGADRSGARSRAATPVSVPVQSVDLTGPVQKRNYRVIFAIVAAAAVLTIVVKAISHYNEPTPAAPNAAPVAKADSKPAEDTGKPTPLDPKLSSAEIQKGLARGAVVSLRFQKGDLVHRGDERFLRNHAAAPGTPTQWAKVFGESFVEESLAMDRGLNLNGTGDYIEIPTVAARTVSLWFQSDNPEQATLLATASGGAAGDALDLGILAPRGLKDGGPADASAFVSFGGRGFAFAAPVIDTRWHQLVMRWDGGSTVRLRIDGLVPQGRALTDLARIAEAAMPQPVALPSAPRSSAVPLWIGRGHGAISGVGREYFRGRIDEVAIWDRFLSDAEVDEVFHMSSQWMNSPCLPIGQAMNPELEPNRAAPYAAGTNNDPLPTAVSPRAIPDGAVVAFGFDEAPIREKSGKRQLRNYAAGSEEPQGWAEFEGDKLDKLPQGNRTTMSFDGQTDGLVLEPAAVRTVAFRFGSSAPNSGILDLGGGTGTSFRVGQIFGTSHPTLPQHEAMLFGLTLDFRTATIVIPVPLKNQHGAHQVIVAWDGDCTVRALLDGNPSAGYVVPAGAADPGILTSQPFKLPAAPKPSKEQIWIGKSNAAWMRYAGWLDEIAMWDRAMSVEEMYALYETSEIARVSYCTMIAREADRKIASQKPPVPPTPLPDPTPKPDPVKPDPVKPDPVATKPPVDVVPPKPPVEEFTLHNGCVGAWACDTRDLTIRGGDGVVKDVSGSGRDLILHSGLRPTKAGIGQSLDFNADRMFASFPLTAQKSVALYVRCASDELHSFYDGSGGNLMPVESRLQGFILGTYQRGSYAHWKLDGPGYFFGLFLVDILVPVKDVKNTWHLLVFSVDGNTANVSVDGKLVPGAVMDAQGVSEERAHAQPFTLPGNHNPGASGSGNAVGRSKGATSLRWRGQIDELAVWDRKLTEEEMVSLWKFIEKKESYCDAIGRAAKKK